MKFQFYFQWCWETSISLPLNVNEEVCSFDCYWHPSCDHEGSLLKDEANHGARTQGFIEKWISRSGALTTLCVWPEFWTFQVRKPMNYVPNQLSQTELSFCC